MLLEKVSDPSVFSTERGCFVSGNVPKPAPEQETAELALGTPVKVIALTSPNYGQYGVISARPRDLGLNVYRVVFVSLCRVSEGAYALYLTRSSITDISR